MASASSLLSDQASRRAFANLLAGIPDDQKRSFYINKLANHWSKFLTFAEAASIVDSLDDNIPETMRLRIACSAEGADYATRFAWLLHGVADSQRENAISTAVLQWTHADFNAVATFLSDLQPSSDRDQAVGIFADMVASTEPPSAVDWALTIDDARHRDRVLQRIYTSWSTTHKQAARDYFAEKKLRIAE